MVQQQHSISPIGLNQSRERHFSWDCLNVLPRSSVLLPYKPILINSEVGVSWQKTQQQF